MEEFSFRFDDLSREEAIELQKRVQAEMARLAIEHRQLSDYIAWRAT